MIALDGIQKSLQLVLSNAKSANDMTWSASFANGAGIAETDGVSDGTTIVTVMPAPMQQVGAIQNGRYLTTFSIFNADDVPQVVTVEYNNNTAIRKICSVDLAVGYTLHYEAGRGWYTTDTNGAVVNIEISLSGISIGQTVVGATAGGLLYVDGSLTLRQSWLSQVANSIVVTDGKIFSSEDGLSYLDFGSGTYVQAYAGDYGAMGCADTGAGIASQQGGYYVMDSTVVTPAGNIVLINPNNTRVIHDTKISFESPVYHFSSATASRVAMFDASSNLVGADTATYPSLTEFSYVKGATSNLQNQINNIIAGLSWKAGVRVQSGANVTIASPGATVDGVAMVAGDRVSLIAETSGADNGLYIWNGAAVPMTRSTDANTGTLMLQATFSIEEGTYAEQIYTCSTNAPITIGVTALTFVKTSATTYTGSNGINLSANNFTLDNSYFTGELSLSSGAGTLLNSAVIGKVLTGYVSGSGTVAGTDTILQAIQKLNGNTVLGRIGASTYSTVQHLFNASISSGRMSGGSITVNGGDVTKFDVAAGTGFLRATDSDVATQNFFDWSASTANSSTTNAVKYVGIQYNSGTPNVVVKTTDTWDFDTEFPMGMVVNEAGTLYIINIPYKTADNMTNVIERFDGTQGIRRDERLGGLILGTSGTRKITVSAGSLLARMDEFTFTALDTNVSGSFDAYYRDGSGGWTKEAAQTQFNVTKYDDGTGTLATLTVLDYSSRWFYAMTDGSVAMLYGQNQYASVALGLGDSAPSSVPNRIQKLGILIGRLVIQASNNTPVATQTVFTNTFSSNQVTSASDLSNGVTGSGTIVLATSPTLVTPVLGVASSTSEIITGTAGAGFIELQTQSSSPSISVSNAVRIFSSGGWMGWRYQNDTYVRKFDGTLTADRTYTLPDKSDTLAGITDVYFTIFGIGSTINPADATTYYYGLALNAPTTTATDKQFAAPFAMTIIGAIQTIGLNTTAGTTENSTLKIRNITTATSSTIGTFKTNGSVTAEINTTITGVSISVAAGDLICFEWLTPTWATNPAGLRIYTTLICKRVS